MKHDQNTNCLSEIAYRLANDKEIKTETINSLSAEEKKALDALIESGSVDTLCADHESSPMKGMWWLM